MSDDKPKVKFIVRIRSPYEDTTIHNEDRIKPIFKPSIPSKLSLSALNPNKKTTLLNEKVNYTIFTSLQPGNTLALSSKPISGKLINQTILTENDITDFSNNIIKDANIMDFDKIYCETQR